MEEVDVGLFKKKPTQSIEVSRLLAMDNQDIEKLLKQHKGTPFKNAKALRKASEDGRRPLEGERGMGAILAAMKGGGTGNQNWKNQPVSSRVHPSRHKAALFQEVKDAMRAGDRQRQIELKAEARKHGYL